MPKYTVVKRRGQTGYRIDILEDNGDCRSILGFNTCAETDAWVMADKKKKREKSESVIGLSRP